MGKRSAERDLFEGNMSSIQREDIGGNFRALQRVHRFAERYWYKMLCSRSRKGHSEGIATIAANRRCVPSELSKVYQSRLRTGTHPAGRPQTIRGGGVKIGIWALGRLPAAR